MTASGDWRHAATQEQIHLAARNIDPTVAHIARVQDYRTVRYLAGQDAAGKSTMWRGSPQAVAA